MPLIKGSQCRALHPADYPRLIELANAGSGLDRTAVLNDLLPMAESVVGIDVDGELQGIALLRRFGRGHIIDRLLQRARSKPNT